MLLVPVLVLLACFGYGIVELVRLSLIDDGELTLANYREFLSRADYIGVLIRTVWVSITVTFFAVLLGYPVAYGIWRYQGNRNLLLIVVILPWLVSIVVRTYGWIIILGPRGLVNETLAWLGVIDHPLRLMFNPLGVVIGLVHVLMPFMIIAILSALLQLDRRLEEASMSLGGRPAYTFLRVTLPLSMPGVMSGVILVYLLSSGAIVTPVLLGGIQDRMIGTQIYQEVMQTFNFPKAATLAIVLLTSGLAVVLPLQMIERRLSHGMGSRHR